jgi:transposase
LLAASVFSSPRPPQISRSAAKSRRLSGFPALQGELTASHVFVLDELLRHIEELEARIARFDARLLDELASEHNALALLQTLPGVDTVGAAMLLVEIGSDMSVFGTSDRLASWVGLCPGNNESSCKSKLSPISTRSTSGRPSRCARSRSSA